MNTSKELIKSNIKKSLLFWKLLVSTGAYSEPSEISKMELFVKIVDGFQLFTILEKTLILDV